jgi:PAS domain S-box-containing protein
MVAAQRPALTASSVPPVSLRALIDAAPDAVLVFDARSNLLLCNRAAMRLLACEPGFSLAQLETALGPELMAWLLLERSGASTGAAAPLPLADGRLVNPAVQPLELGQWALRLDVRHEPHARAMPEAPAWDSPASRQLLRLFWDSPFPATLQDRDFRLVAVNQAYLDFSGYPRERLIGLDPIELQPAEDRVASRAARAAMNFEVVDDSSLAPMIERRLIDASGHERWFRLARSIVAGPQGGPLMLCIVHDITAERVAREQADRSLRELDEWFDLSPVGMVLFDETGLLLRSNLAFASLVGEPPLVLSQAAPELQQLLGFENRRLDATLVPGSEPQQRLVSLALPDGRRLRLRALLRGFATGSGQRRCMAVVEDRSAEEERELAQLEIGALMDTASIGIATYEESRGWLRSAKGRPAAGGGGGGLQSIGRDIVDPDSLPEYERLQRALKQGERAEVRYAVNHPDIGRRWLLTRVEPGRLGSGRRTTSLVTLDITEQEQARLRNEHLLRELSTLLDSSTAGIAYLRDGVLLRCNARFERMLGLDGRALPGEDLYALLGDESVAQPVLRAALQTLREQRMFETEMFIPAAGQDQGPRQDTWYSLSVRRAASDGEALESVAVLTDITRLKTQQEALERARQSLVMQADRTRAILDSVLVGIVTVGAGGIEWMNRSARRMFAGELADFVGLPISTVATPEADHPLRRTHYLHALAEGEAESFECRLKARDGREFWVVGNTVATGEATERQLTFALLDIERRRQAEVSIAQAQASLQRIIETAPLAIGLLDARSLQFLQINQMAAMFAGASVSQAAGRSPAQLFEPAFAQQFEQDLRDALGRQEPTRHEYRRELMGELRVWDARTVPLAAPGAAAQAPEQLLFVASDVTEQRAAEEARLQAAIAQREMLVKEVHHRIKNNLQGVAGLMQQIALRRPEVAAVLQEAVGQVHAIAQVYGLQVGSGGPLRVRSVLEAITASVQRMFGCRIAVDVQGPQPERWALPEAESIPIALTINELLTNAIKHGGGEVRCTLHCGEDGVSVAVANPGRLPAGFRLAQVPGGVSGLGLVRALLPRRGASLTLAEEGDEVVARITLSPPGVAVLSPP